MKIIPTLLVAAGMTSSLAWAADHTNHHHMMHDHHAMPTMDNMAEMEDEHSEHMDSKENNEQKPIVFEKPSDEEVAAAFPLTDDAHMHSSTANVFSSTIEKLEYHRADHVEGAAWEGSVSFGNAFNKLWLKSEGERINGLTEHADFRVYGSHAISPWWEATAGLVQQVGIGPDRHFLMLGAQGETPFFFDMQASALMGSSGQLGLGIELENDVLLTNRLVLQTRPAIKAWLKEDVVREVTRGVNEVSVGMRLRYEIRREFAPYVGFEWVKKIGNAADLGLSKCL